MLGSRLSRIVILLATMLAMLWLSPAGAQQRVDCGNGHYCPADNACLVGGLCGVMVDHPPGSTRTSTGEWCEPGMRESKVRPGGCIPNDYLDCRSGACPPGSTCGADGGCVGGPSADGPVCGGRQCLAGRVCSSKGTCMNPAFTQDCGNGTLCTKHSACEHPSGCVFVGQGRTRQIPYR